MSTFILDGYGYDCRIKEVSEGYSLFLDDDHVITMSQPWMIVELMGRGDTGHDLQRHLAVQVHLVRQVDLALAAGGDVAQDLPFAVDNGFFFEEGFFFQPLNFILLRHDGEIGRASCRERV